MPDHMGAFDRVIVASNRLPCVLSRDDGGTLRVRGGSGGLVSALRPALEQRGGVWVGWSGSVDEPSHGVDATLSAFARGAPYELAAVPMSSEERDEFYRGFSNEVLWPLFHDMAAHCNFVPQYWRTYQALNRRFAAEIARHRRSGDVIWVHDYHLLLTGQELRNLGVTQPVGSFLHIPFPEPGMFGKLPWRRAIVEAMCQYDLIGFQTARDRDNFLATMDRYGAGLPKPNARVFPIGIDFDDYDGRARHDDTRARATELRAGLEGQTIFLGVDRLDYSKGLIHKLAAFRLALTEHPELRGRVTLIQQVVPSREDIPSYAQLRTELERQVSSINGAFTRDNWVPVRYLYQHMSPEELSAHYVAADVLLATPVKDGMNLVCKEYCASRTDGDGVLILSELAGAASQLGADALTIQPFDLEGVAGAIWKAVTMPAGEQARRMEALRLQVRDAHVFEWTSMFLEALASPARPPHGILRPVRSAAPAAMGSPSLRASRLTS